MVEDAKKSKSGDKKPRELVKKKPTLSEPDLAFFGLCKITAEIEIEKMGQKAEVLVPFPEDDFANGVIYPFGMSGPVGKKENEPPVDGVISARFNAEEYLKALLKAFPEVRFVTRGDVEKHFGKTVEELTSEVD